MSQLNPYGIRNTEGKIPLAVLTTRLPSWTLPVAPTRTTTQNSILNPVQSAVRKRQPAECRPSPLSSPSSVPGKQNRIGREPGPHLIQRCQHSQPRNQRSVFFLTRQFRPDIALRPFLEVSHGVPLSPPPKTLINPPISGDHRHHQRRRR